MKKILHITECLGSGVLFYVKNMCKWQINDYEVVVAYATRPETPEDFEKQFDPKVKLIKVNNFTREITPSKDLMAFFEVRKIVKDEKPDLIHLHSTKAGVIGRWAINCNKYRVLYSPHAYSFLMNDCSERKRNFYAFVEKLSDRKKCTTIADTENELEASKRVCSNSICIKNGVDLSDLDKIVNEVHSRQSKYGKSGKKRICMLGKVVPQKNPLLFNDIAKRIPECDFLWIGAGPLEDVLDSSNICVTGWMVREDALTEVINSDIFLFTSAWESLSIALLEVMYLGIPCVVSDIEENTDVIKNGVNGFSCGKIEEYVKSIRLLLENQETAQAYAKQARQEIIDTYNTNQIKEKYKKLYVRLGMLEQ